MAPIRSVIFAVIIVLGSLLSNVYIGNEAKAGSLGVGEFPSFEVLQSRCPDLFLKYKFTKKEYESMDRFEKSATMDACNIQSIKDKKASK